jgi:hypothetical protein
MCCPFSKSHGVIRKDFDCFFRFRFSKQIDGNISSDCLPAADKSQQWKEGIFTIYHQPKAKEQQIGKKKDGEKQTGTGQMGKCLGIEIRTVCGKKQQ